VPVVEADEKFDRYYKLKSLGCDLKSVEQKIEQLLGDFPDVS